MNTATNKQRSTGAYTQGRKRLEWGDIHATMRKLFLGREHWFIAFDSGAVKLIGAIYRAHYQGRGVEDFNLGTVTVPEGQIGILAMRKSRLPAPAYAALLKKAGAAALTPREVAERDVLVIASDANLDLASAVIDRLVCAPDAPRCIPASAVPTHKGNLDGLVMEA